MGAEAGHLAFAAHSRTRLLPASAQIDEGGRGLATVTGGGARGETYPGVGRPLGLLVAANYAATTVIEELVTVYPDGNPL